MQLPPDEINGRVGEWFLVTYRQVIGSVPCVTTHCDPVRLSGRVFMQRPLKLIVVFDCLADPQMTLTVEWKDLVNLEPTKARV